MAGPFAALVLGSDSNFYGTTEVGGSGPCDSGDLGNGCGTVFRISPSGSESNLHSFGNSPDDGQYPAGIVKGSDGNIYGTTGGGGTNNVGTIFRISPSGAYTILYSFGDFPTDGNGPEGLVEGYDSNFYGTTSQGGTNNISCFNGCGTVFRISSSGSYTSLYSFAGYLNGDGGDPQPGLVQGTDGNFYGTTSSGGTNSDSGIIFRISSSGTYTILHSFVGSANDGAYPEAGLVQGSDGNFYGTTSQGGPSTNCPYGCGVVFQLDVGLGPCGMSLGTTNAAFDAAGGSDSVSVTASNGCVWGAGAMRASLRSLPAAPGRATGRLVIRWRPIPMPASRPGR